MTSSAITLSDLQAMIANDQPIAMLTCYDASTARWLDQADIPMLLVGDTAAEMVLGYDATIYAPLDFMIQLTAAVKRAAPNRFVVGDMPFMSYQIDTAEAIRHAGRFLTEGHADMVKLEVDHRHLELIERLATAGVPTMAHLGSHPQRVRQQGGYKAAGQTNDDAKQLIETAKQMQQAGASMLLLEAIPAELAQQIVEQVDLPIIGCGAGPHCHGQVIVFHDLMGLSQWQPPFAPAQIQLGELIKQTAAQWAASLNR